MDLPTAFKIVYSKGVSRSQRETLLQSLHRSIHSADLIEQQLVSLGAKLPSDEEINAAQEFLNQHDNTTILFITDPTYPQQLRFISGAPLMLWLMGDRSLLNTVSIAIVGSRLASVHARALTSRWIPKLIREHITIVSGLAEGVDTLAHAAALSYKGKTMGVCGHGLGHYYPRSNRKLFQQVAEYGLLISEYLPTQKPRASMFPQRNRIVAGLSQAVWIVEARLKSGSLITARLGAEQSKPVFVTPGSPLDGAMSGNLELLLQGAEMLVSEQQLIDATQENETDDLLSSVDSSAIQFIGSGGVTTQEVAEHLTWSLADSLAWLSKEEIEGRVIFKEGLWYSIFT